MMVVEDNIWEEFFRSAPYGTGGVLYEAGINFLRELNYIPSALFDASNIQTIVIPDNITSIEAWAFYECSNLTSVIIPDSVTSIGSSAFRKCSSLASIEIPDSVTSIGDSAFYGCSSLTSVTIPDSVTSIGHAAFCRCDNLTSVTIPDSVTSIGGFAFSDCGKLEINYAGTVDKWEELIGIGNNDRVFKNTTCTCNCTDGVVK